MGWFQQEVGRKFLQPMPLSHTNATMLAMHAPIRQDGFGSSKGAGRGVALAFPGGVAPKFGSERRRVTQGCRRYSCGCRATLRN